MNFRDRSTWSASYKYRGSTPTRWDKLGKMSFAMALDVRKSWIYTLFRHSSIVSPEHFRFLDGRRVYPSSHLLWRYEMHFDDRSDSAARISGLPLEESLTCQSQALGTILLHSLRPIFWVFGHVTRTWIAHGWPMSFTIMAVVKERRCHFFQACTDLRQLPLP